MNNLQVVDERQVLGVDFKIYGDFENPLFLAKDVANWIDYEGTNVGKMLNLVDEDEKVKMFCSLGVSNNCTKPVIATGPANRWFLTEDGLYEVLMQSRKPIAKQFKKQVKMILKELRKGNIKLTPQLSDKDVAILNIINSSNDIEQALAIKQFESLVTQPLVTKIEEDKPKVEIADKRLLKNGCYTLTEVTKSLNLKRGQITKWAKEQGYIHKKIVEVNKQGEEYFKIYDNGGFKCIGITEQGLQLINKTLKNK